MKMYMLQVDFKIWNQPKEKTPIFSTKWYTSYSL